MLHGRKQLKKKKKKFLKPMIETISESLSRREKKRTISR